jgi:tellurite resistance protein TerC
MIEITDIMFALDSIPAILAVTTDPFIVYSSNMFAILGLRSLYFFLAHMLRKFHYLKYSVFAILVFVSIKLLATHHVEFPEWFSLTLIAVSLTMGVVVSLQKRKQKVRRWKTAKRKAADIDKTK